MEHLEFLVEEASMETALAVLVPRILDPTPIFRIHPHQGKPDLLQKLPGRLRGYRPWLPTDCGIVVVMDEDRADCRGLKRGLEQHARAAGFRTSSQPGRGGRFQVLNWLAIEELEAWYFGDPRAIAAAYPGVPETLGKKAGFRNPDAIRGGTWEALERVLQRAGHHRGGLQKVRAAREIAPRMDPEANSSPSFTGFKERLRRLAGR